MGAEDWTILNEPTSRASTRTFLGVTRAKEGPFTWRRKEDKWHLERADFDELRVLGPSPNTGAQARPGLYLILHSQAPGEPNHWCLSVAHENEKGDTYQVTGDAEFMHYAHEKGVNRFQAEDFKTAYTMVKELFPDAEDLLKRVVDEEKPPSAPNRASISENCQGWCWRVLSRLAEQGIVTQGTLEDVKRMIEPV
ncbi:hypothetical protein M011DRAFT_478127 [Sporormia fimetaria CBS 119925]|uniref:Uncharacterized protein n=1 Tax=Sporormia fimetaria CBS 119925 TaxID=1340428 RepID=A0A6A6V9X3_9PLEO|nr:hypothetical protein M011DRAFT_478127 [Sporormia fimetaria CBS 119925]